MSKAHIPKPPKKIERPRATINHISLSIASSRCALATRNDFGSDIGSVFCGAVPYFAFKDGRMLTSITYIERKRTTAVMMAKAFW